MTSRPTGPPSLTEVEYWRDYDIIRTNVSAAIGSWHTQIAIHNIVTKNPDVLQKMYRHRDFWRVCSYGLQTTFFIVLARILDADGSVHSIHQVLASTIAHPEFFSRNSLRARKLAIPDHQWNPQELDEYVRNAWEPAVQDLRLLKKALAPHKAKFDIIYKPLRDQIFAHTILKDQTLITDLFSKTLRTDIDEILLFLHSLMSAIKDISQNAQRPQLNGDHYGYGKRIAEITAETESLLGRLT